ncbi:VOC family protein [Candidatus Sumerlaeota bacterium]|nr:VOC family protein [Candidatus Sumerlaeota bacterium]
MIKQLAHICINSPDLELTKRFYIEALGLEIGFEFEKDGEPFGYYIKAGNMTFIEVFKGDPGPVGNISHVAIQVTDLDALIARIRDAGFKVDDKKLGADNAWQAWTTDPSGIRIEFHEYTEHSNQLAGGKCIVNW